MRGERRLAGKRTSRQGPSAVARGCGCRGFGTGNCKLFCSRHAPRAVAALEIRDDFTKSVTAHGVCLLLFCSSPARVLQRQPILQRAAAPSNLSPLAGVARRKHWKCYVNRFYKYKRAKNRAVCFEGMARDQAPVWTNQNYPFACRNCGWNDKASQDSRTARS